MPTKLRNIWRLPKTVQWVARLFLIYLLLFTIGRLATAICFKPAKTEWTELLPSFLLGIKYDLRWIALLLIPIILSSCYSKFSPFYNKRNKQIWTYYLGIMTIVVLFFYGADFAQFAYVNARLNADALIFAEDPKESLQMVWQSYPIVWIILGLAVAVTIINKLFKKTHHWIEEKIHTPQQKEFTPHWHVTSLLLLSWFIYGFLCLAPLDFQRAFRLNEEFKSNLALNPLQNFFTTLQFRKPDYSNEAKKYYPRMATFLHLDDNTRNKQSYQRICTSEKYPLESQPNIVLVFCESFSMYKSSMSGNPLNTTPYFQNLCKEGVFFNRCFSTSFGTARAVFSTITGIPDVQLSKFSTRNEASIHQRTIINAWEGYDKFYFIGGNSGFNNFSGLMENIHGVKIIDEKNFNQPKLNVWGISDKDLLLTSIGQLAKSKKPFFAIIQTADNHRPFNIPEADTDFIKKQVPKDSLTKYGFESLEEYHAFCYTDYCIQKFMEAAKKESYFNNTLFVFVGDHGVEGNPGALYPNAWSEQRLSDEHIPLLFYAPALLPAALHGETVSQIDILPSIAGLTLSSYPNSTLGRDLFQNNKEPAAFIMYHAPGWIGLVNDQYFYRKNIRINKDELVPAAAGIPYPTQSQSDSIKKEMGLLTDAIYQTSKWMLLHNSPK